jgi:phage tail-like protein
MSTVMATARYELSADGRRVGAFRNLSGLQAEREIVEYIPSREPATVFLNRYAGKRKRMSMRLVRPRGTAMELRAWHEAARLNPAKGPKKLTLQLFDGADKPIARYHLENAWPSKLEIGGLKAGGAASMMETVTITCEFIQRVG